MQPQERYREKTKAVTADLALWQIESLKAVAAASDRSLASVLRQAVQFYLARQHKILKPEQN